ncbi:class I tRNA ligase family protein, partial [Acinetobacter baumannii]
PVDQWVLEQADLLAADAIEAYQTYEFSRALGGVHNFCVNQLSSFYLDAIKDRIYCDGANWPQRRSAQYACRKMLISLTKLIAPILCH